MATASRGFCFSVSSAVDAAGRAVDRVVISSMASSAYEVVPALRRWTSTMREPNAVRIRYVIYQPASTASPLVLQPLNTNMSFRDQAYAALKQAIVEADIYAHDNELRLDERQLSQSLGVSRTPIREAMTLLEQEGFLRTIPRRGIFIVRKTKKQIIEMIDMWASIESMAARLATQRATDREIAGLRAMMAEFQVARPDEH